MILDLSRADDVAEEEKDEEAAEVDGTSYLRIRGECETSQSIYSGTVQTAPQAMTFHTSTSYTPMMLTLDGTLVFPLVESWAECAEGGITLEKQVAPEEYEVVDPDCGSITVELGKDALVVSVGEKIPEAGTYRLTIEYCFNSVYFAQTQITFFVNYSDGSLMRV